MNFSPVAEGWKLYHWSTWNFLIPTGTRHYMIFFSEFMWNFLFDEVLKSLPLKCKNFLLALQKKRDWFVWFSFWSSREIYTSISTRTQWSPSNHWTAGIFYTPVETETSLWDMTSLWKFMGNFSPLDEGRIESCVYDHKQDFTIVHLDMAERKYSLRYRFYLEFR